MLVCNLRLSTLNITTTTNKDFLDAYRMSSIYVQKATCLPLIEHLPQFLPFAHKSLKQLEKALGGRSLFPLYPASLLPLEPFPALHTQGAVQMLELDQVSTLAQG